MLKNFEFPMHEHIGERKGIEKGIEKGRREGLEEGLKKGHYDTALKMLKAKETDIKIRQYTSLSQKEIDRLKKEVA